MTLDFFDDVIHHPLASNYMTNTSNYMKKNVIFKIIEKRVYCSVAISVLLVSRSNQYLSGL